MRAEEFWQEVNDTQTRGEVLSLPGDHYKTGDKIHHSLTPFDGYRLDEVLYVTSPDDPHYGAVLFINDRGKVEGSVKTVSGERFLDVIETMQALQVGEITFDEMFTSSEEWKREIFKRVYGK